MKLHQYMVYRIGPVILFGFSLHLVVPISTAGEAQHSSGEKTLLVPERGERISVYYIEEVLS